MLRPFRSFAAVSFRKNLGTERLDGFPVVAAGCFE